jgi:hypothetical protein
MRLSQNVHDIFTKIFTKQNFAKIVPFLHDLRFFAKIEKWLFVSTVVETNLNFSIFAKMIKSCENGPILLNFLVLHKISVQDIFCEIL